MQLQAGGPSPVLPPLPGPCLSRVTYVNVFFMCIPAWFCTPGRKVPLMSNISHETGFSSGPAGTQGNRIPLRLRGFSCYDQCRGTSRLKPRTFAYKALHKIVTLLKGFSKLSLLFQWTLLQPPSLSGHSLFIPLKLLGSAKYILPL